VFVGDVAVPVEQLEFFGFFDGSVRWKFFCKVYMSVKFTDSNI